MRPVIVALDFENQQVVTDFLDQFPESEPVMVKVGMELFYKQALVFYEHYVNGVSRFFLI